MMLLLDDYLYALFLDEFRSDLRALIREESHVAVS